MGTHRKAPKVRDGRAPAKAWLDEEEWCRLIDLMQVGNRTTAEVLRLGLNELWRKERGETPGA